MSRFIRIEHTVIHIPSLANVTMHSTSFWKKPCLILHFHNQDTKSGKIVYKRNTWNTCELDLMRIKYAMDVCEEALSLVPLAVDPSILPSSSSKNNEDEAEATNETQVEIIETQTLATQ